MALLYYLWTISTTVSGAEWSRLEVWQLLLCAMLPFGAWFSIGLIRRKALAASVA
jgi:hypothetical protein